MEIYTVEKDTSIFKETTENTVGYLLTDRQNILARFSKLHSGKVFLDTCNTQVSKISQSDLHRLNKFYNPIIDVTGYVQKITFEYYMNYTIEEDNAIDIGMKIKLLKQFLAIEAFKLEGLVNYLVFDKKFYMRFLERPYKTKMKNNTLMRIKNKKIVAEIVSEQDKLIKVTFTIILDSVNNQTYNIQIDKKVGSDIVTKEQDTFNYSILDKKYMNIVLMNFSKIDCYKYLKLHIND